MKFNYPIIIVLLASSLMACVSSQPSKFAAHDEDQDIGLGGTGMLASSGNGLGGTGIVGEITGFGSVFVNGIEVEYNTKTPFSINGEKSSFQQLNIGDIVEILTTNDKTHTNAKIINLRHEVIGRVESVNKITHSFKIQGQNIIQARNRDLPEIGNDIAVSGLRLNNETIQATRLSSAKAMSTFLRTNNELPFINQATRWIIQTHVKNGKVTLSTDGITRDILLPYKANEDNSSSSAIKIINLQKIIKAGEFIFTKEVDALNMPRGSRTETPAIQSRQQFQRRLPTPKMPVMRR